jgi:SAM-dependent methyltransferase
MRQLISRRSFIAAASLVPVASMAQSGAQKEREPDLDAPYVPTPQDVVDRMLELAKVTAEDYVMDLGCGDGRILVTAAAKFGARGFGVDIDPKRIKEAKANAVAAGVADKIDFGIEDLFHTPIGKASVLALYLFPHINELLAPRMLKEMKPGSRIVTHGFGIGKWRPDMNDMVAMRPIHFYVVPANVEGTWRITPATGRPFNLSLIQSFQRITGFVEGVDGVRLRNARLAGPQIAFALETTGAPRLEFTGAVDGEKITGAGWTAVRTTTQAPR